MSVKIALSMGDAAGIGPEILVKLFARNDIQGEMVVVGDFCILEEANRILGNPVRIEKFSTWDEPDQEHQTIPQSHTMRVIDLGLLTKDHFAIARADKTCGSASVAYLRKTAQLASEGAVDAIVSAPLNKEAMKMSGIAFQGQTELLADFAGVTEFAMVLLFGPIKLFFQSNHIALRSIFDEITTEKILGKLQFIHHILDGMGDQNDKIAVAALNPHAGENGKMGREEIDVIKPAISQANDLGIQAVGPIPADSIFIRAKNGEFNNVLVMYHDQGNIAAKLLNFGSGVTYVAGLPFIRTSVAHGTAYDIAGKGIANESTLAEAVKLAVRLAKARRTA